MKMARVKWLEGMQFIGEAPSGHSIKMDGPVESGGSDTAVRPGELTLVALGGCTGFDIVSILKKMRIHLESFEVIVEADQKDDHPKTWKKLHLKYILRGRKIDEAKVKQAIELSQNKYCSVAAIMRASAELTWEYQIISD